MDQFITHTTNRWLQVRFFNIEIEREIAGLNMNLNAKNDKVINNVGRMQLSNMAKDYYTMKNAYSLAIQ